MDIKEQHGSHGEATIRTTNSTPSDFWLTMKIKAVIKRHSLLIKEKNIFFQPDIPDRKLRSAIKAYAPTVDEKDVLVLIDCTFFGSATDGAILTSTAFYAHNQLEPPCHVDLSGMTHVQLREGLTRSNSVLDVNNTKFLEVYGCLNTVTRLFTVMLCDIVEEFHHHQNCIPLRIKHDGHAPAEDLAHVNQLTGQVARFVRQLDKSSCDLRPVIISLLAIGPEAVPILVDLCNSTAPEYSDIRKVSLRASLILFAVASGDADIEKTLIELSGGELYDELSPDWHEARATARQYLGAKDPLESKPNAIGFTAREGLRYGFSKKQKQSLPVVFATLFAIALGMIGAIRNDLNTNTQQNISGAEALWGMIFSPWFAIGLPVGALVGMFVALFIRDRIICPKCGSWKTTLRLGKDKTETKEAICERCGSVWGIMAGDRVSQHNGE